MRCARCGGAVIRETDPYDGERFVCINCGRGPAITPLDKWLAEQEYPTESYWPRRTTGKRVAPPTRRYD